MFQRLFPIKIALIAMLIWQIADAVCVAHETWVLPASFQIVLERPIRADFTSGMLFPKNETPIRSERIESARLRLNGKWTSDLQTTAGETSLKIEAKAKEAGIAALCIQLKPKDIELSDSQVTEYFDEINASEEIRKAWSSIQGKAKWKETYTKHAKTIIAIGNVANDTSWKEPAGLNLEIVPRVDPFQVASESEFELQVLSVGKPIANFAVGFILEGQTERMFAKTDANGIAKFKMRGSGKALLYAVDLRLKEDSSWASDFTTFTFEVR